MRIENAVLSPVELVFSFLNERRRYSKSASSSSFSPRLRNRFRIESTMGLQLTCRVHLFLLPPILHSTCTAWAIMVLSL
jgi:hypothetical protein